MLTKLINKIKMKWINEPVYEFICSPIERILYAKEFIYRFDRVKYFPEEKRRISVAIANYERPELLVVTLKNIFRDERVSEVVILDDGSSLDEFLKCTDQLKCFGSKVRLFRREQNLGPFATKIQACSLCSNSWCILLDSDNTIFDNYLNTIFSLEIWDENIIYAAEYAFPHYNFKTYANSTFDFHTVCDLHRSNKILTNNFIFSCLMSGGNYFLNAKVFTTILQTYLNLRPCATDSILTNYIWFSQGNKLKILPNTSYYHRIHSRSIWLLNHHQGVVEYMAIANKFDRKQKATLADLQLDFISVESIDCKIDRVPL